MAKLHQVTAFRFGHSSHELVISLITDEKLKALRVEQAQWVKENS